MRKNKTEGKNPSLLVAQPVKWMNLKKLSVRINNVLYLPTLLVQNITMNKSPNKVIISNSDYRNKQLAALLNY